MSTVVWISLAVFCVAVAGGIAVATVRGLAAWRAFRGSRRRLEEALLEATRRLAQAEERVAGAAAKAAELERARARLQESLALAAMLTSVAGEVWEFADRVSGAVPRK